MFKPEAPRGYPWWGGSAWDTSPGNISTRFRQSRPSGRIEDKQSPRRMPRDPRNRLRTNSPWSPQSFFHFLERSLSKSSLRKLQCHHLLHLKVLCTFRMHFVKWTEGLAKRRMRSKNCPWMSPYTCSLDQKQLNEAALMGARSLRTISWDFSTLERCELKASWAPHL